MAVITVTKGNFEEEVLKSSQIVILDFWADWCGPCNMQSPILDVFAKEKGDLVKIGKINVDEEAELALKYQVMSIPTIVIMKQGVLQKKLVGLQQLEELEQLVEGIS